MGGNVARMCENRNIRTYRVWWGGTIGKRLLGRLRRRREDNIRTDVKAAAGLWKGMNWIDLAQDTDKCWAVVNTVMNIQVP